MNRATEGSTTVLVEEVAAPQTLAEAIAVLKRRPDAIPWAGGTLLLGHEDGNRQDRPLSILDLGGIPELRAVARTDRYLELGACVTLASILELPANLPLEPLRTAARLVGTATVRNLATIGGNVAAKDSFMTCFAALACMDAAVELRDPSGTRWVSIHVLVDADGKPSLPPGTLISRLRVPVSPWDAAAIRPVGEPASGDRFAPTFAATARFEKETISELRILTAARRLVRDRGFELSLVGKRLPLSQKDVEGTKGSLRAAALAAGLSEGAASQIASYAEAFLAGALERSL